MINIAISNNPWCDPCDKSFRSQSEFQAHLSEHKICGVNHCVFVGNAKVVAQHIEQQHNTGLYKEIATLCSAEDIAKWREDRKKKYPTISNVTLRQVAQAERKRRGEKLDERKGRFGERNDRRPQKQDFHNKSHIRRTEHIKWNDKYKYKSDVSGRLRRNRNKTQNQSKYDSNVSNGRNDSKNTEYNLMFNGNLRKFQGTLICLKNDENTDENDTEYSISPIEKDVHSNSKNDCDTKTAPITENQPRENQIDGNTSKTQNLFCNTDSDNLKILLEYSVNLSEADENKLDNCDEDLPDECPIERVSEENIVINEGSVSTEVSKSSRKAVTRRHTVERNSQHTSKRTVERNSQHTSKRIKLPEKNLLNYSKLSKRPQNTMLEKLLETEIRHERNVLLQCVRYIVKNQFFDINSKVSS